MMLAGLPGRAYHHHLLAVEPKNLALLCFRFSDLTWEPSMDSTPWRRYTGKAGGYRKAVDGICFPTGTDVCARSHSSCHASVRVTVSRSSALTFPLFFPGSWNFASLPHHKYKRINARAVRLNEGIS